MIQIELGARTPEPTRAFDAAHRLGERLVDRHAAMLCRVDVHGRRRPMLRWRISDIDIHVEVHWALLGHPDELLAVLEGDDTGWEALMDRVPKPLPPLRPHGEVHDLVAVLGAQLQHVPESPDVRITWGRWPGRAPKQRLRLGSFSKPVIRIHPVLDHVSVPAWFVGAIVHHELLHAVVPIPVRGGRRQIHSPEFRCREASHPDYARAEAWQRDHITNLLRRCRERVARRS